MVILAEEVCVSTYSAGWPSGGPVGPEVLRHSGQDTGVLVLMLEGCLSVVNERAMDERRELTLPC